MQLINEESEEKFNMLQRTNNHEIKENELISEMHHLGLSEEQIRNILNS